jgi:predicted  nucleic acid-binding Zn-ribbon protein
MQETIRALLALQEIDQDVFRVREELRRLPAERAQRRTRIDARIAQRKAAEERARSLRFRIREIEDMTTQQRQRMRKVENQANSTRQDMALLAAFQHEVKTLKRDISTAEEEALGLIEEAEGVEAELSALKAEIDEAEKVFAEFDANVVRETAAAEARLTELRAELEQRKRGGTIAPEVLSTYMRLLDAREGMALAELDGRICQMCYMEVTPNLFVRVVRGTEVVQCPSCDRILYQRG